MKTMVILCCALCACSGATATDEPRADAGVDAVVICGDGESGDCAGGEPGPLTCRTLGCEFAPWGWCGASEPACDGRSSFSSVPSQASCEAGALSACSTIGYPTPECWITFAQDCSPADTTAAHLHCLRTHGLPPGSLCRLQWR